MTQSPIQEAVKCASAGDIITGARYFGKAPESKGKDKTFNFSEDAFFQVKECDIDPIIFIRMALPLADPATPLPQIRPEDFYDTHPKAYGVDIEIRPDYKTCISQELINLGQDKYDEKLKLMEPFGKGTLKLFKEYINSLTLTDNDFMKEALKKIKEKRTQYDALSSKKDELVSPIIDPKYQKLLTIREESLEQVRKILEIQTKYFLRFMNTVSMKRMQGL